MLDSIRVKIKHVAEKSIRSHWLKSVFRKLICREILEIRRNNDIRTGCRRRCHNMAVISIRELHSRDQTLPLFISNL